MGFSVTPIIGAANVNTVDANTQGGVSIQPAFALGTAVQSNDGGTLVYVKALSELSAFAACAVYADGTAQMLTTTIAATCKRVAWAQVSVPSGYCAWLQSGGTFRGNLAANCDDNVALYTTATAGVLDDATVSGGLIGGVTSTVTISNATAVTLLGAFAPFIVTGAVPSV
jgi:hypothetical protein